MSDAYASLVLQVDSSQTKTAATALNQLTVAAQPAAAATTALTNATKPAVAAHASMSTQAMSAFHSVRSLTESLIAGQSPTQALALQLNHAAYAGTAGFKELAGNVAALINPMTLAAAGAVGIAAGFGIAITKIAASEVAFSQLSSRLGTTVQDLHALQSAAADRGIGSDEFTKGIERFGSLTYDAARNMGSLAEYFRLTGIQAGTLDQNFGHAADLIAHAKDDAARYAIITQLGLPPTARWVELLKSGSAGIAKAKDEAVALGGVTDEALVQRAKDFDSWWNKTWNNWETHGKAAIINIADGLSKLNDELEAGFKPKVNLDTVLGQGDIGRAPRNLSADLGVNDIGRKTTPDLNAQKNQLSQESARISLLGVLATSTDQVRQKQIELNLADIAGTGVTKALAAAILERTRNDALGITQIREQVAQQEILTAQFGMSAGEAAAYAAVQEKINAARIAGRTFWDDDIARLKAEAEALGNVVQLNSNLAEAKSAATDVFGGLAKDLVAGRSAAEALHSAIGKIENRLIDMATNALLQRAFALLSFGGGAPAPIASGTSVGAPTQHSGGIVGIDVGPSRTVPMSVFAGAPRFHAGGMLNDDETGIIAQKGEGIFTRAQLRSLAPVGSGGGTQVIINNHADNSQVQSSTRKERGIDITEVIISTVGKHLANGGYDPALRARTNTQLQPRPR